MPQLSTHLEPRMSPWGWPDGLVHNSRILRTSFLGTRFHKLLQESTRMPFKHRKRYSPTSRKARVLVVQASVMAFLQDLSSKIFFLWVAQHEKSRKINTDKLPTRNNFLRSSTKNPFFGSQVLVFTSNPSRLKYWLRHFLFYAEAMCKGSTGNGLLYAAKAVS